MCFRIDGEENTGHSMGGPNFIGPNKHPYEDNECRHTNRFEYYGVLTCSDCGASYNEITLEWINHAKN